MSDVGMKRLISVFIWLFLVVPCWAEAPIVELETNFGDIVIELFDANAPVTVANFLGYVKSGYGNDDSGSESGSAYILKLCPDADLDGDCSVTLNDLAILTDNWLLH